MNRCPLIVAPESTFTLAIPRIRTSRLLLREPRRDDFEGQAAYAADPVASQHLGGPVERRESWRRFLIGAGSWLVSGMGWWTIEHTTAGAIGTVGVFRRESHPDVEMGWLVQPAHWGRGFATEAANAALAHAFGHWAPSRVVAFVAPGNAASIRVAERIGMTFNGEADFYGERDLLYVANRPAHDA